MMNEFTPTDLDLEVDVNPTDLIPDYDNAIIELIRSSASPRQIQDRLQDYHANDIAEILPDLTPKERNRLYYLLSAKDLSEILEYPEEEDVAFYLSELSPKKAASILEELEPSTASDILEELAPERSALLLDLLDEESRRTIDLLSSYDDDLIGSVMSTNYIVIPNTLSVKQAMGSLITQAAEHDNVTTIFVVDDKNIFYGAIHLTDLIIAREGSPIEDLITTFFPYVYATETIDDCIERLKDYSEDSIPVLSNNNQILGVITARDIIEVVDDEMGEDYARLAGLTAEEDLREPLLQSMRKRLPWLITLLALGLMVSSVVSVFESVVSQLPLIIAFQSLILDMSGNVGTQSLAVTIRVMMDEKLTGKQKLMLVGKEMRVGFSNGLLLGAISFLFVGLFIYLFKAKTLIFAFSISACIGCALLLAMIISSVTGTVIPLFFKKVGVDPAVASGPLITTVNDLVAVVSYYGLAWIFLLNLLKLA